MPAERTSFSAKMSMSKLQLPTTLEWLKDNYEEQEGGSLPRNSLYAHYLDFCQRNGVVPVNAASFGKIIKVTFPNLKTRRLGTRGQSKYHYYGIGLQESSRMRHIFTCSTNVGSFSDFSNPGSSPGFNSSLEGEFALTGEESVSTLGGYGPTPGNTILPSFTQLLSPQIPEGAPREGTLTFLIMYHAHCQRLLDTILRANFTEVQKYLAHFWQGIPLHLHHILLHKDVADLVTVCDKILYRAMSGVLVPSMLQALPPSLSQAILGFSSQVPVWLSSALPDHLPEYLRVGKVEVAKTFSRLLQHKTTLSNLSQAARVVLNSAEDTAAIVNQLQTIDLDYISVETALYMQEDLVESLAVEIQFCMTQFVHLVQQQASLEYHVDWLNELFDRNLSKFRYGDKSRQQRAAQQFLLGWSFTTNQIVQELTLKGSSCFGAVRILQMMYNEYLTCLASTRLEEIEGDMEHTSVDTTLNPALTSPVDVTSVEGLGEVSPTVLTTVLYSTSCSSPRASATLSGFRPTPTALEAPSGNLWEPDHPLDSLIPTSTTWSAVAYGVDSPTWISGRVRSPVTDPSVYHW